MYYSNYRSVNFSKKTITVIGGIEQQAVTMFL